MISIHPPMKPSGGGKRVARFTVGTSMAGWTAADCDYLCDGTDDQVEINAAIQALPATGGEVVILDGTYNITAAVLLNRGNTTLAGNGQGTKLKRMWNSAANEGVIHVTSSWNTVQNLAVDGNKESYTKSYNDGILLKTSFYSLITGSEFYSNAGNGISLQGSSKSCRVIGNLLHENYCGINIGGFSDDATVTGNTCCSLGDDGIGIFTAARRTTITGNTCDSTGVGIQIRLASTPTTTGNTCNNCSIGIHLYYTGGATIAGNVCVSCSDGIRMEYAYNCNVIGNVYIRNNGAVQDYENSMHTIYLSGTENKYNIIAYNLIMGKNYTSEGGTGNTFTGNKYN